jgi:peptidyl-prolyl cis-trans isomerase D
MALINKIREKSGIAVSVIAIALLLFILGGDLFSGNSMSGGLFGGDQNKVGTINGVDVDYQQFQRLVDAQRQQLELSTGRSASEADLRNIREQVWEQLVQENAFKPEYEALGIDVAPDELREMIQGAKNMHPFIRQQFTDPSTGIFNEEQHREFINAAANKTLPAEQQVIWDTFKNNLIQIRKSEKYQNLISSADYITTSEAKKEYQSTNNTISADYLYVPFYSVSDTVVKVSDSDISTYYSSHKDEFSPYDSRTFDYVVYHVNPSREDSASLQSELVALARGLASAESAQAYAAANTDVRSPYLWNPGELSDEVRELISTAIVGGTLGPVKDGQEYSIYKYEGTEQDTVYTLRASHILVNTQGMDDAAKTEARTRAQELLSQIKAGADFATMARINGSDGTASSGGDLGYFSNDGRMIKAFEDAVFRFSGEGLLPNLVETEFGYHIVKVTDKKSNLKYKLATITKVLEPSDATLNEAYQDAEALRASLKNSKQLKEKADADENLTLFTADRVGPGASSFNTITEARDVVLWAFGKDAEVGKVADRTFVVGNSYLVAALAGATDKEEPKAEDFRAQIEAKVRNQKKADLILAKLKPDAGGDLQAVANAYGAGALVESVTDINIQTGMLNSAGIDAIAIGRAFGQKLNQTGKPFAGQNGVFIIRKTSESIAPEIADYNQSKAEIIQRRGGSYVSANAADQAVRAAAEIVDRRAKMF